MASRSLPRAPAPLAPPAPAAVVLLLHPKKARPVRLQAAVTPALSRMRERQSTKADV